ncbi:hypothetical protein WJ438_37660 [Streptomyces sp. GD-15H]|uniref:hypothetical protein n=1 Tax=Streptomyces sp. GD-15H TaxID=3129112 RepID=UPI003248DB0D
MDLLRFRNTRATRRSEPAETEVLPLIAGGLHGGPLLVSLSTLVRQGAEDLPGSARFLSEDYLTQPEALTEEALRRLHPGMNDDAANGPSGQQQLRQLVSLDVWLVDQAGQPDLLELERRLNAMLPQGGPQDDDDRRRAVAAPQPGFEIVFGAAWARLADGLAAALLDPHGAGRGPRITRLLMVAGLVHARKKRRRAFGSVDEVDALLRLRTPLLPPEIFPAVLPERRVRLVRDATVSDLYIVRSEWRCYQAGEIADIRNVLAGEKLEHRVLQIDEREITDVTEVETTTTEERSEESSEQQQLSEEAQRELRSALHAEGQVDTSGQYGPTHVNASVSGSADYSLTEATSRSATLAREAVSRALSRVESRVRTERTARQLTRHEDAATHTISNDKERAQHVNGIYRWVDRIDRLQIFRYPNRLQLEFQLPEPGRMLRDKLSKPATSGGLSDPGPFSVDPAAITPETYRNLIAQYQAVGVPAPPEPRISVTQALAIDPPQLPNNGDTVRNPASVTKSAEIAIPSGYAANHIAVSGQATPVLAKWLRESTADQNRGFGDLEGFHTIAVTLAAADQRWTFVQPGPHVEGEHRANSVQDEGTKEREVQYVDALLDFSAQSALDIPLPSKVPVAFSATAASAATATVELVCVPTEQAMREWQRNVYEALLAAHEDRIRAYRAERNLLGADQRRLRERSPARHAEMIRDEIKRHVIAWLLDEEDGFRGRHALKGEHGYDIDLEQASRFAPEIQFLEQAFEWTNLTYVLYPYYWADRDEWPELLELEAVDSELARFLRSGSARVVVPARPGMTNAVAHWLLYRQPWQGGLPPVPGDPGYLSVATEIRDLVQPPADGQPGESWEVRTPTTLRWLDRSTELPHNPAARLGQAPHEPAEPLCADA